MREALDDVERFVDKVEPLFWQEEATTIGTHNPCYVNLPGIPCNGTGFHVVTRPGTPLPPDGRYGRFFMPVVLHHFAAAVDGNRQNGS